MIKEFATILGQAICEDPSITDKHYDLVYRMTDTGGKVYILDKTSPNDFQSVKAFAKFNSWSYLRQNGQESVAEITTGNKAGYADITVPFRFVMFTKEDLSFKQEAIISLFMANKSRLRYGSKASMLQYGSITINTNMEEIITAEFPDERQKYLDLKMGAIMLDISIIFTKKSGCYVYSC
jgi:hypothetical protein